MSNFTTYKSLELPAIDEKYDVGVANKNNMVIDSELHKLDLKNQSQDNLLATKESLLSEVTRATAKENDIISNLTREISRATSAEQNINSDLSQHTSNESNPHNVTKTQVGLGNVDNTSDTDKPVSTAQQNALDSAICAHNIAESSHSDVRLLISDITTRLNAIADSDDTTLDQLSEIVAYIKNNKDLIDSITTSKVSVSDIIDDLTTDSGEKVLSSRQGMILNGLLTALTTVVEDKVDKVSGKGLSTNDFTDEEKQKLNNLQNTTVDAVLNKDSVNPVQNSVIATELEEKAPLNNPNFTGTVTVPNSSDDDNSTSAANTAFVQKTINNALSGIFKTVQTLPTIGTKGVIYLISRDASKEQDNYDEYIWVNDTYGYERIGGTTIDLSKYSETVELTQAEYDALDETKNSDNKTYLIKDGDPGGIDIEGTEVETENTDALNPESYTEIKLLPAKFSIKSLFNKFVCIVKNVRWLKSQNDKLGGISIYPDILTQEEYDNLSDEIKSTTKMWFLIKK